VYTAERTRYLGTLGVHALAIERMREGHLVRFSDCTQEVRVEFDGFTSAARKSHVKAPVESAAKDLKLGSVKFDAAMVKWLQVMNWASDSGRKDAEIRKVAFEKAKDYSAEMAQIYDDGEAELTLSTFLTERLTSIYAAGARKGALAVHPAMFSLADFNSVRDRVVVQWNKAARAVPKRSFREDDPNSYQDRSTSGSPSKRVNNLGNGRSPPTAPRHVNNQRSQQQHQAQPPFQAGRNQATDGLCLACKGTDHSFAACRNPSYAKIDRGRMFADNRNTICVAFNNSTEGCQHPPCRFVHCCSFCGRDHAFGSCRMNNIAHLHEGRTQPSMLLLKAIQIVLRLSANIRPRSIFA
jgi:hypothetical protein